MSWSTNYNVDEALEAEIKCLDSLRKLKEEYSTQISKIEARITELRNDYSAENRGERIANMQGCISNLEYGLQGILSNIRAKEHTILRLEAEKHDSHHDNEARN